MTPQAEYRTVFDISQESFDWRFPLAGLGFVCIGAGLIWLARRNRWPLSKSWVAYFMVVFASLWSIGTFATLRSEYSRLQSAYREGDFLVVEGIVENFRPMPYQGHQNECFSVEGKSFCYSDYVLTAGFNNSRSHGGPIEEGLPVRVSYVGNDILRLEVMSDALASAQDRSNFAEAAGAEYQQRTLHDPVVRRLNLGFGLAMVFMTAWWNLQWGRFMKFWMKPPYRAWAIRIFRIFFAANLVGAFWYVIGQVLLTDLSRADLLAGTEMGGAMIGVVFLLVNIVEWINRPRVEME